MDETIYVILKVMFDFALECGSVNMRKSTTLWQGDTKSHMDLGAVNSEQQRRRPACASSQTDQRFSYSLIGKYHIKTCYSEIALLQLFSVDFDLILYVPTTIFQLCRIGSS